MINYNVSDFIGVLIVIGLFAYMTNLLQWGLFQVVQHFFENPEQINKVFHHHFHYKAKK